MRTSAFAAALALIGAPTSALAGAPSEVVKSFYAPVGYETDPSLREKFTDPAVGVLEKNDRLSRGGEMGCITFGLAIDAQDFNQSEIDSTLELTETVAGDEAEVVARFDLFADQEDVEREIVWMLKDIGGAWKVADIASPEGGWRLSEFACD